MQLPLIIQTSPLWLTALTLLSCSSLPASETQPVTGADCRGAQAAILQVNDSYKIEGLENGHIGGFARLRQLRKQLEAQGEPVLLVHAGDFLFPSVMSKYLQADAMIQVMNLLDGKAAAFDNNMVVGFGNHEFDHPDPGLLLRRIVQSDFAWLSSNSRYQFSDSGEAEPLSKRLSNVHDVLIKPVGNLRLGLFGLTLDSQQPAYIHFDYDPDSRRALVSKAIAALKAQGAEVIIALTHQDLAQDQWLAREFPEINLIIGGHEHFYTAQQIGNTWITKADADNQSAILHRLCLNPDQPLTSHHQKIELNDHIEKDPLVSAEVSKQLARLSAEFDKHGQQLNQIVGYTEQLLEGVEPAVRGRETALGNFLADSARQRMQTDIALINGGSIRLNDNIRPGPLTLYDLEGIFYYDNQLVSFALSGQQIVDILRNSVSKSHLGDGRFLQVSGLRFRYHAQASNEGYQYSIDPADIAIKTRHDHDYRPLVLTKTYRVASLSFLWEKGYLDGYSLFARAAGTTSPPRLDKGKPISFRKTVEAALARLPHQTITQSLEDRIIRDENRMAPK